MPLGIDIGGTKIAYGHVEHGKLIWKKKISTPSTKHEIINTLIHIIETYEGNIIGIGVPGQVKDGHIIFTPNIPLSNTPLKNIIEKATAKKIFIENDANAFLLAEHLWGAVKGYQNVIGLTLGTGIGGAIIINNQIWQGSHGAGAEFGHLSILEDGPICGCGNRGCIETLASPKSIEKWVDEQLIHGFTAPPFQCTMENIFKFKKQHPLYMMAYERFVRFIGMAVANFVNILDPQIVVFGGSGVLSWNYWYEDAYNIYNRRVLPSLKGKIPWVQAHFLSESGIIGAAATTITYG